ncbi:MAG: hypothetical protein NT001_02345, partial [Candidatus Woesearchaeota archaeon]|nr:hypothetical protein [Candidatus Woesearchaeota archaeon]
KMLKTISKKAMIFTSPRDTISCILGLILLAFGVIPLLSTLKMISWNLPSFLTNLPTGVLIWVVAIAGFYILIDGFIEPPMHIFHWLLIFAGLIMMVIGLIPILHSFGTIGFTIPGMDSLIIYWVINYFLVSIVSKKGCNHERRI